MQGLEHTEHIERLLAEGRKDEAAEIHNAHVAAELERAKSEPICLSDFMGGREAFTLDEIKPRYRGQTRHGDWSD